MASTTTAEPPVTTTSRAKTSMAAGVGRGATACPAVSRGAALGATSRAPSGSVPSARRSSSAVGFWISTRSIFAVAGYA